MRGKERGNIEYNSLMLTEGTAAPWHTLMGREENRYLESQAWVVQVAQEANEAVSVCGSTTLNLATIDLGRQGTSLRILWFSDLQGTEFE